MRTASTFLFRHARTTRKVVRRPASKPEIVVGVRADCGIFITTVLMSVGLMPRRIACCIDLTGVRNGVEAKQMLHVEMDKR